MGGYRNHIMEVGKMNIINIGGEMTAKEFNALKPEDFKNQDVLTDIFYSLRDYEAEIKALNEFLMDKSGIPKPTTNLALQEEK